MIKVKIFTEAGTNIGLGHLSRCSALYDEIVSRGANAELIVYGDVEDTTVIQGRNAKNINWLSKDYLEVYVSPTDHCIVDSYLAPIELYEVISKIARECVFIDDNMRLNYPKGIIVNPSLNSLNMGYSFDFNSTYFLGERYIILRKPFLQARSNKMQEDVKKVLITMGGADPKNITPEIISSICVKFPNITFDIIIGKAFNNINQITSLNLANVNFLYDINAYMMKEKMEECDFAITAAGQTIYELIAMKIPMIAIKVAENQKSNIEGLRNSGIKAFIIDNETKFISHQLSIFFEYMLFKSSREECIKSYDGCIDGKGINRIVNELLREECGYGDTLIRKVRVEDSKNIFDLSNQDYVRKYSINRKNIIWEEHKKWFKNILNNNKTYFYILEDIERKLLGQVRYQIEENKAIVSISISDSSGGRGLGRYLLRKTMLELLGGTKKISQVNAYIIPENVTSINLFKSLGYIYIGKNNNLLQYTYYIRGDNDEHRRA